MHTPPYLYFTRGEICTCHLWDTLQSLTLFHQHVFTPDPIRIVHTLYCSCSSTQSQFVTYVHFYSLVPVSIYFVVIEVDHEISCIKLSSQLPLWNSSHVDNFGHVAFITISKQVAVLLCNTAPSATELWEIWFLVLCLNVTCDDITAQNWHTLFLQLWIATFSPNLKLLIKKHNPSL